MLTKLTEAELHRRLEAAAEAQAGLAALPPAQGVEALGRLALDQALCRHALGQDPAEVRRLLRQAATQLAQGLLTRPRSGAVPRDPVQALALVSAVCAFGSAAETRLLARLEPAQIRNPALPRTELVGRFLTVLLRSLGGDRTDLAMLRAIAVGCEAETAHRADRLELLPLVRGMLAVEAADERGWNLALAQLTAAHSAEARWGDLRHDTLGLACLPATMLLRRGLDRNLRCRASSPWLPVALLQAVPA